jgi:hypothetical protein
MKLVIHIAEREEGSEFSFRTVSNESFTSREEAIERFRSIVEAIPAKDIQLVHSKTTMTFDFDKHLADVKSKVAQPEIKSSGKPNKKTGGIKIF